MNSRPCGRPNAQRSRNSPRAAFHIITGLLLPIWNRLPAENMRVYRFETEDGERVIGRLVTPEALGRRPSALRRRGAPFCTPDEAWTAVLDRGATLDLAGDLQIRRVARHGAHRVELTGYTDGAVPQLKALGLISEIIAWRLRLFVPTAPTTGPGDPRRPPRPPSARAHCRQTGGLSGSAAMSGPGWRSGAPPRARRRGRVPSLPLQRPPPGPLLDSRRRPKHPGRAAFMSASTAPIRSRRRRQMDRICCAESYVAQLRLGAVSRTIDSFYAT